MGKATGGKGNGGMGYVCAGCGSLLFRGDAAADSRTGRPTFTEAVEGSVELVPYTRNGTNLTFIRCRRCGRLIGQLADEGSDRHAIRLCVNCGALGFEQK